MNARRRYKQRTDDLRIAWFERQLPGSPTLDLIAEFGELPDAVTADRFLDVKQVLPTAVTGATEPLPRAKQSLPESDPPVGGSATSRDPRTGLIPTPPDSTERPWGLAACAVTLMLVLGGAAWVARTTEQGEPANLAVTTNKPSSHPAAMALAQQVGAVDGALNGFQNFDHSTIRNGATYWGWSDPIPCPKKKTPIMCLDQDGSWYINIDGPLPPLYAEHAAIEESLRGLDTILQENRWPTDAHDGIPGKFTVSQYRDAVEGVEAASVTVEFQGVGGLAGGYPKRTDSADTIERRIERSMPVLDQAVSAYQVARSRLTDELRIS